MQFDGDDVVIPVIHRPDEGRLKALAFGASLRLERSLPADRTTELPTYTVSHDGQKI